MKPSEKEALTAFLKTRENIVFAYLFGSQVSGTAGPMSDIDIAIYTQGLFEFDEHMKLLSDLMIQLRTKQVDLVDLRTAPPVLAYEIIRSGEMLFSTDANAENKFERKAALHYFDTQHLRNIQNQYLRAHLSAS